MQELFSMEICSFLAKNLFKIYFMRGKILYKNANFVKCFAEILKIHDLSIVGAE